MEILTKKKKMRVCVGGAGTIPIYKDVQVLETYGRFVLAQHPDGQCGIYIDEGTDVLLGSRIFFGEIPGTYSTPGREIKVTNEPEARQKWDQLVNELELKDAEKAEREASMAAVQKQRENKAQIRDMKIKKIVAAKNQAIDSLRQHIQKPGVDLFSAKTSDLVDSVVRCEKLLKYL